MSKLILKEKYNTEVKKALAAEFGIASVMAVPAIHKVVLNAGIGSSAKDKNEIAKMVAQVAGIAGQKPSIRPARVSIAGFGLRRGMPVGLAVTLRGGRAFDFLHKLISIVLPRLRDFRGVSTRSFDNSGNFTLGLTELSVFPDFDTSKYEKSGGLEITIVIKNGSRERSKRLLELLGMPFAKDVT